MKLGFIGCGQMAQALAKGFVKAKLFEAKAIILSDKFQPSLDAMKLLGYHTTLDNAEVVRQSDVVFLAVKPKDAESVLRNDVCTNWNDSKLLISICAGITVDTLASCNADTCMQAPSRVIRVMPNTCCLVGESATCFTRSAKTTDQDVELANKMFSAVGRCHEIEECYMNAVTGLSGSGPAFIFILIEAMSDAGVKGGLSREVARDLAAQTVLGSAKMVLESSMHPGQLRDSVTSPGGTTIVGVAELEKTGFRHSIISAIDAARLKSEDMTRCSSKQK